MIKFVFYSKKRGRSILIQGEPIAYDVKRLRQNQPIKSMVLVHKLKDDLIKMLGVEGETIWKNIRGKPKWKRKGGILLCGKPGTGKTLFQKIITRGLEFGQVDNNNENFPLANCYKVEVIIWEEARLSFQNVDMYKKVLEGRDYVISVKHEQSVLQSDWTPVVITTNDTGFPSDVSISDKSAIRERCYKIECREKWFSLKSEELEEVDFDQLSRLLDIKWL